MYSHLPNEIEAGENTDRTNNIIIGIAVGVMIVLSGIIYVAGVVMNS